LDEEIRPAGWFGRENAANGNARKTDR